MYNELVSVSNIRHNGRQVCDRFVDREADKESENLNKNNV